VTRTARVKTPTTISAPYQIYKTFRFERDAMGRETSNRPFPWERVYADTLVEINDERLVVRIKTMEAVLLMRLLDLTEHPKHAVELQAVEEALCALAVLKKKRGIA
jgi:hypothetical protein